MWEQLLKTQVDGALDQQERDLNMKTRLLPVLLLTATFPFAALAQTSTGGSSSSGDQGATSGATNPGGTGGTSSSSNNNDNGTGTSDNGATGPSGTGGTSSSSNNNDSGTGSGSNTNTDSPGTGGTSAPSSSSGTTSDAGANSSANGSGTGALSTSGSPGTASAETFVTIPNSGTWRLADLQGKTVYSVDGSNIGEINDVLVSQNGSVNAVIIGVGGFLGIGEKNVAVNISALQVAPSQMTGATGTTGSDMSANSAGTSSAQSNMASAADNRIILNVTRDQLESAPAYQGMGSQP